MASPSLIYTDRQALVALAQILQGVDTSAGDLDLFSALSAVLAVLAAGSVQSGPSSYRAGTLAPISLTTTGALRVQTTEQSVRWFGPNPWAGQVRWRR